jgi:hypothetical protein
VASCPTVVRSMKGSEAKGMSYPMTPVSSGTLSPARRSLKIKPNAERSFSGWWVRLGRDELGGTHPVGLGVPSGIGPDVLREAPPTHQRAIAVSPVGRSVDRPTIEVVGLQPIRDPGIRGRRRRRRARPPGRPVTDWVQEPTTQPLGQPVNTLPRPRRQPHQHLLVSRRTVLEVRLLRGGLGAGPIRFLLAEHDSNAAQ